MKEQREPEPLKAIIFMTHLTTRIIFVLLKESVAEYGDKGRQANGAVEQVAEGEVEKQQRLPFFHPRELIRVAEENEDFQTERFTKERL